MSEERHSLGETVDALCAIIEQRRGADAEASYTARLLTGPWDSALKKVSEEAGEVVMAAKDAIHTGSDTDHAHLRYEAVDLLYHLLVVCARAQVSPAELEAEIRGRF